MQQRSKARARARRWLARLLQRGERAAQEQPRAGSAQRRPCSKQGTKEVEK
jgi:hypothetical protein